MTTAALDLPRTAAKAAAPATTALLQQRAAARRRRTANRVERWFGRLLMKHGRGGSRFQGFGWLHRLGLLTRPLDGWTDTATVEAMPHGPQDDRLPRGPRHPHTDAPLAQAPVIHPDSYAPVLHLDADDRRDHRDANVTRYIGQLLLRLPGAIWKATRRGRVRVGSDADFTRILTQTAAAQYLQPLQESDRPAFGKAGLGAGALYEVDLTGIVHEDPLPGLHSAPTRTLLARRADGGWQARAIRCGDDVFMPADGDHWRLARLFVMVGLQHQLITLSHPRQHFPCDVVHAATKAFLPEGHVLARLLKPHRHLTLGLHEAVVHHRRSVLHNSQRELYTPFSFEADALHENLVRGRTGLGGKAGISAHRLDAVLCGRHTAYGRYLHDWYAHILAFTRQIATLVALDDPAVVAWADHIHAHLPDFPAGAHAHGEALARALALVVLTVSVAHTAEHHSIGHEDAADVPMRLRTPPPRHGVPVDLSPAALQHPEDALRRELFQHMFFQPAIHAPLHEVTYDFRQPRAREAAEAFVTGFVLLDHAWAGTSFPTSHEIAASIQF